MSAVSRFVRRETKQEQEARKALKRYLQETKDAQRVLFDTCHSCGSNRFLAHGRRLEKRLLWDEAEPYKEWKKDVTLCVGEQVHKLEMNRAMQNVHIDSLVMTPFLKLRLLSS